MNELLVLVTHVFAVTNYIDIEKKLQESFGISKVLCGLYFLSLNPAFELLVCSREFLVGEFALAIEILKELDVQEKVILLHVEVGIVSDFAE